MFTFIVNKYHDSQYIWNISVGIGVKRLKTEYWYSNTIGGNLSENN